MYPVHLNFKPRLRGNDILLNNKKPRDEAIKAYITVCAKAWGFKT